MSQMTSGSRLRVTTPDLVTFSVPIAGLVRRVCAWLIDQLIVLLIKVVVIVYLGGSAGLGVAVILVLLLLIDFGYFTFFEWERQGQTPGKKRMGIAVQTVHGGHLNAGDILLRNLLRMVDSLPMFGLVGGLVAWLDPLHRRLGDLAAGTVVIREGKVRIPEALRRMADRENAFESIPGVRDRVNRRVTREERDLLMDLALRRDDLDPLARDALFRKAWGHFAARFDLPELDHLTSEQAVINLALITARPSRFVPGVESGDDKTASGR